MVDFLKKVGVSDETINYINKNFSTDSISALSDNEEECINIITLLKTMGIINIEDLLIYETYIFYKSSDEIYYELSKHNLPDIAKEIINDYSKIEEYI